MDIEFLNTLKEEIKGLKLELALIREEEARVRKRVEIIEKKLSQIGERKKNSDSPDSENSDIKFMLML